MNEKDENLRVETNPENQFKKDQGKEIIRLVVKSNDKGHLITTNFNIENTPVWKVRQILLECHKEISAFAMDLKV